MRESRLKRAMRWLLAAGFMLAGINHFVKPDLYAAVMPPYLPHPYELALLSGVFEIVGAIGLLVPRVSRAAAWGLIALLVAVFPANLHMALNPEVGAAVWPDLPRFVYWARLPFQAVFVAWAYWFTRRSEPV